MVPILRLIFGYRAITNNIEMHIVEFLLENDCKYIQGYYYSRPYELEKIIESKMNNEDYISKIGK